LKINLISFYKRCAVRIFFFHRP